MNALKTGALALTLIIAVPILLGFGMASETTTEEYYEKTDSVNLTDLILNSETDYYAKYTGVANNTMLFQILNSNDTSWSEYVAPEYVSVSSNYTTIPEYTKTSGTLSLDAATTTTHTNINPEGAVIVGINEDDVDDWAYYYNHDFVKVTLDENNSYTVRYETTSGNTTDFTASAGGTYSVIRTSLGYNLYDSDGIVYENAGWVGFYADYDSNSYTVVSRDATEISETICSINLNEEFGAVYFDETSCIGSYGYLDVFGSTAYLDEVMYLNATPISILITDTSVTSLAYTYGTAVSGSYADPSYGWTLPDVALDPVPSGDSVDTYWTNAAVNGSVTFDLAFSGNGTVGFSVYDTVNSVTRTYSVAYSSGVLTFTVDGTAHSIGTYDYARLVIDLANGEVSLSGLTSWSAFGETPTAYSTYTAEYTNTLGEPLRGEFTLVKITDSNDVCCFRVPSADVVAGTFPSTLNFTFSPIAYYPDSEHLTIYFNSVGIYGDSLTVAGQTFTTSPLKKTIEFTYNEDSSNWTTVYDGSTMTTATAPTIVFNGEWSLTITGAFYESATKEVQKWVPGGFAFDQDDFILCMILTSVGVFVVLGLMKGTKVGILAFVCGAAGIIAYIIA